MKIRELDDTIVGKRIVVTHVAASQAEDLGYCEDTKRLLGKKGIATELHHNGVLADFAQLVVDWDDPDPGSLMLAGADEVEVCSD